MNYSHKKKDVMEESVSVS